MPACLQKKAGSGFFQTVWLGWRKESTVGEIAVLLPQVAPWQSRDTLGSRPPLQGKAMRGTANKRIRKGLSGTPGEIARATSLRTVRAAAADRPRLAGRQRGPEAQLALSPLGRTPGTALN